MSSILNEQACSLYRLFSELVRGYQFRDRDGITCFGVSVSQCYTLQALADLGSLTMGELAQHLSLEISSVTRLVDQLVERKLVRRFEDPGDRRVRRVETTDRGRALVSSIREDLIREHEAVLRQLPEESREAVISAMAHLLTAFRRRHEKPDSAELKSARHSPGCAPTPESTGPVENPDD